jgi:hypothetical protein
MKNLAEGVKSVFKRVIQANMSLEHYWFLKKHAMANTPRESDKLKKND